MTKEASAPTLVDELAELRSQVAALRAENARLLRLLKLTPRQAAPPGPVQTGFFEAPPGPVHAGSPPEVKVAFFAALFAARTDIYATRWENRRSGKAGWLPAVRGGWRKGVRHADREYLPLTAEVVTAHLSGELDLGLYPLLDGDRCWWLAADFDGHTAMLDALAYLKAARAVGVPTALEVSRSGFGRARVGSSPRPSRPRRPANWAAGCCGRPWRCGVGWIWPAMTGSSRPRMCSRTVGSGT